MPLSSWSRTKRPPTQACDWQLHDGKTASLRNIQQTRGLVVFWVFFIWMEWNIYINERPRNTSIRPKKKKKVVFFLPQISFRRKKKSSIHFWNLFCTFCEISSETWTEVKRGLVLHKIPACSTRPLQNKESHKRPTLPDLLNTLNIHFAFYFPSITFIKASIGL